jgi:anti-sigma B factor antagonist
MRAEGKPVIRGLQSAPKGNMLWPLTTFLHGSGRQWREVLMALSTASTTIDGVIVVYCGGAILWWEESTSLRLFVKDLLNKSRQIVLDLGDVTRIDSGGLGTLVALYISARNVGGDIKLANLGSRVNELLQITKLVTVFDVFDKAEDAVASFKRAAAAT